MKPIEIKEISEKDYVDSFPENYMDEEKDPREVDDFEKYKYKKEDFFDAI